MDKTETVSAQVILPVDLYETIEHQAQKHGQSVNHEIVQILSLILTQPTDQLEQEFAEWEAASDEDWHMMESMVSAEAN